MKLQRGERHLDSLCGWWPYRIPSLRQNSLARAHLDRPQSGNFLDGVMNQPKVTFLNALTGREGEESRPTRGRERGHEAADVCKVRRVAGEGATTSTAW